MWMISALGGNEWFHREVIEKLKQKLEVGEIEQERFKYIGLNINQSRNQITMSQEQYINSIEIPKKDVKDSERELTREEMKNFRGIIGQLNWVSQHTMPEVSFAVSSLGRQMKKARIIDLKNATKVVRKIKEKRTGITLEKIELSRSHLEVYTDASLGKGKEGESQIGFIISLKQEEKVCPILWKSNKAKRIARSTIEAEALALADGLESAIYIREILKEINLQEIPIVGNTDSKTLERAIKTTSGVLNRRLRIDIAALKEMLRANIFSEVQWVSTKVQVADCLTKSGVNEEKMRNYLKN